MIESNKSVVLKFIESMSTADAETAASCLRPEVLAITKGFSHFAGASNRERIVGMIGSLKDLVPTGLRTSILNVVAEGDQVVVEFEGDAETCAGTSYANQYCMVFTMADGRIKRFHEYFCTKLAEDVLWPLVSAVSLPPPEVG